jgi:transcriptional antiterminator RfaH
MNHWLVVTRKGPQKVAEENLSAQGFATYFPKFLDKIIERGRICRVERPLFGRYFFVGHSGESNSISSTRGVSSVIGNIIASELEKIRRREVNGFVKLDQENEFKIGQKVRICGGIFNDMIGVYEGMSTYSREKVLLGMMGRKTRAEVDAKDLVAA